MVTIQEAVREFKKIEGAYKDNQAKEALNNLMKSFLVRYGAYNTDSIEPDAVAGAVEDTVRAYTSDKDKAIFIFKNFIGYLLKKYKIAIEIDFPPIPVMNVYERLMYMAKYLQSPKHRLADLEDILWLSERSIRQDYSLLKGSGDSAVQILGKTFSIPDIESKKGQISMPSTVHPLFLTGNLTQIIVVLKGLKLMSENPVYKDYAMTMAAAIWDQLSKYAKDRILFVTEQYLSESVEWYKQLNDQNLRFLFLSEYQTGRDERVGCVLDCLKNRKACCIEYLNEDGTMVLIDKCKVTNLRTDNAVVEIDGRTQELVIDQIMRSAYSIEELY